MGVGAGLVLAVLAVVGFDLRTAVTSVSAALPDIHADLHATGLFDGLVSSLAPLVFAASGLAAPTVLRRLGTARGLVVALAVTTLGLALRTLSPNEWWFVLLGIPTLAGLGTANVAMPAVVKQFLPHRIGIGTTAYTAMLAVGTATAAALTVPVAAAFGGWRAGLGIWVLPLVAGIAVSVPLMRARPRSEPVGRPESGERPEPGERPIEQAAPSRLTLREVASTRLGWAVAMLMAGQSASSYLMFAYLPTIAVDHGFSASSGGLLLSVFSLLGATASVLPVLLGGLRDHRWVITVLSGFWAVGALGMIAAPGAAWLWVVFLGLGSSLFTVGLLVIPLRTATVAGTAALSGFALSVAYVVSAAVVFAAGLVRTATGTWVPVLASIAVLMVAVVAAGLCAGRPGTVEAALGRPGHPAGRG